MNIDPLQLIAQNRNFVRSAPSVSMPSATREFERMLEEKVNSLNLLDKNIENGATVVQRMQLDLMRALLIDDDNKDDQQSIFADLQNMFIEPGTVRSQMIDKYAAAQNNSFLNSAPTERNKIDRLIDRVADHVRLDSELIHAVVNAESAYQPEAVSHAGARGLMQLMPATAAELGVRDSFDAEQNLLGGSRYLRQLLDKYEGDLDHALAAYNWGQGNVDRQGLDKMPQETRQYIARIKQSLQGSSA